MCMFIGDVRKVTNTRIMVYPVDGGRQMIIYENTVENGTRHNAMVLPVPVGRVEFHNLQGHASVFEQAEKHFPQFNTAGGGFSFGGSWGGPATRSLPVQQVGSYQCSVAPSLEDMLRLRTDVFAVPDNLRQILSEHYGTGFSFVVCQFSGTTVAHHPIAFSCQRLTERELFIPTRHAHGASTGSMAHQNIICDGCGLLPFTGTRYRCTQCPHIPGIDLCEQCFKTRGARIITATINPLPHERNHVFCVYDDISPGPTGIVAMDAAPDPFDHTLFLLDCTLSASPSRYTTTEHKAVGDMRYIVAPHAKLYQSVQRVEIHGTMPNRDYIACVDY